MTKRTILQERNTKRQLLKQMVLHLFGGWNP